VDLEIVRAGKSMTVTTQIKEQPAGYMTGKVNPQQSPPPSPQNPGDQDENEGENALARVHVGELTPALVRQLDLPNGVRGVVVIDVDSGAGIGDLQKGDVIEQVNQQSITSVADFNKVAQAADSSQPMVLSVCRHRVRSFLVLRPR
jgi:serine protease Do